MNNELAGYFLYNEEYKEWEETHAGTPNSVPLYIHPVKEQLTDEEIADFLYAYCLDMGDVYEVSEEQFIKCVRAILKEAQDL